MKKFPALLLIILVSSLSAGIYGILHDVVTYRISPEYYTHYKFIDFGLTDASDQHIANPQLLAVFAGFMATWWVGFIVSAVLGAVVLKFTNSNSRELIRFTIHNTLLILAVVLICGLIGYIWGSIVADGSERHISWRDILLTSQQARSFTIVSFIHSFGYIGSVIGFAIAITRTVNKIKKSNLPNTAN